jgi:hypothetical protein
MTHMKCVELIPASIGPTKAGIVIHSEYQKTPLWFGEATYTDVFEASGRELAHEDDEDGVVGAMYSTLEGFPLWALYGDGGCLAHVYYFDEYQILQGVTFQPAAFVAVKIGDLVMNPYILARHDSGLEYATFDVLLVKLRNHLGELLKGERILTKYRGLYKNEGIWFSAGPENLDLVYSVGFFSQEALSIPLEEVGWSKVLQAREERRAAAMEQDQPF